MTVSRSICSIVSTIILPHNGDGVLQKEFQNMELIITVTTYHVNIDKKSNNVIYIRYNAMLIAPARKKK